MVQEHVSANLSPALCRAARGLLDWTQNDLAEHAAVSRSTVRDFEGGRHDIHRATGAQLRRAFEDHLVAFVMIDGVGPGVCLRVR
jgi:DNA-binding XRE family transcriptional regulator